EPHAVRLGARPIVMHAPASPNSMVERTAQSGRTLTMTVRRPAVIQEDGRPADVRRGRENTACSPPRLPPWLLAISDVLTSCKDRAVNPDAIVHRLTAILSCDAVGYSRLLAEDEVATVRTLQVHREHIAALVRQHRGRVVDSPGDNLLAEFPSALDAARGAAEIQRAVEARNADVPPHRRMEFRIGVHLGDVMVEGDRIYGEGINIAARLEGLPPPAPA